MDQLQINQGIHVNSKTVSRWPKRLKPLIELGFIDELCVSIPEYVVGSY